MQLLTVQWQLYQSPRLSLVQWELVRTMCIACNFCSSNQMREMEILSTSVHSEAGNETATPDPSLAPAAIAMMQQRAATAAAAATAAYYPYPAAGGTASLPQPQAVIPSQAIASSKFLCPEFEIGLIRHVKGWSSDGIWIFMCLFASLYWSLVSLLLNWNANRFNRQLSLAPLRPSLWCSTWVRPPLTNNTFCTVPCSTTQSTLSPGRWLHLLYCVTEADDEVWLWRNLALTLLAWYPLIHTLIMFYKRHPIRDTSSLHRISKRLWLVLHHKLRDRKYMWGEETLFDVSLE